MTITREDAGLLVCPPRDAPSEPPDPADLADEELSQRRKRVAFDSPEGIALQREAVARATWAQRPHKWREA